MNSHKTLEAPLHCKLQYARAVQGIDPLQGAEAAAARIRNQVTGLADLRVVRIAAGVTERHKLDRIHAVAILNVEIRMVQDIESLHLQRKTLTFGQLEAARQSEVNLLRPRSVERIQARKWAWSGSINAKRGVR